MKQSFEYRIFLLVSEISVTLDGRQTIKQRDRTAEWLGIPGTGRSQARQE